MRRLRERARDERGFTVIELLTVVLIIGILAAIAIPSFIDQTGKAVDASAKELAHTAQVATEDYATDNNGSYSGLSPSILRQYESTIQISGGTGNAWVSGATGTQNGYTITVTPASGGETFSISRSSSGAFSRSCTPSTGLNGGCTNGTW